MAKQPQRVNDAHAVHADDVARADVAIEFGIRARIDELGNVERNMLAAPAVGDCREDTLNRLVVRQDVDRKAK
jgi:hypothetical protein